MSRYSTMLCYKIIKQLDQFIYYPASKIADDKQINTWYHPNGGPDLQITERIILLVMVNTFFFFFETSVTALSTRG